MLTFASTKKAEKCSGIHFSAAPVKIIYIYTGMIYRYILVIQSYKYMCVNVQTYIFAMMSQGDTDLPDVVLTPPSLTKSLCVRNIRRALHHRWSDGYNMYDVLRDLLNCMYHATYAISLDGITLTL